jgi:hypothetical protein
MLLVTLIHVDVRRHPDRRLPLPFPAGTAGVSCAHPSGSQTHELVSHPSPGVPLPGTRSASPAGSRLGAAPPLRAGARTIGTGIAILLMTYLPRRPDGPASDSSTGRVLGQPEGASEPPILRTRRCRRPGCGLGHMGHPSRLWRPSDGPRPCAGVSRGAAEDLGRDLTSDRTFIPPMPDTAMPGVGCVR